MGDSAKQKAGFHTTKWTLICQAGGMSPQQRELATETLCRIYWEPVYWFVLRSEGDAHRARDLTQGFFQDILARDLFGSAEKDKGRFRSYLLAACKNFLAKDFQKNSAEKRGGNRKHFSLDFHRTESFDIASGQGTPDQIYDRQWALTVLAQVMNRLAEDYRNKGKEELFEQLKHRLTAADRGQGYQEIGQSLGLSEAAVKMQVHRMKKKYRIFLRETVESIVASPDEVDEEIGYLFTALSY